MSANNEPRVYFLRSKTVCRGQELNFIGRRPRDPPWFLPPPISDFEPFPLRQIVIPKEYCQQDECMADHGLALLNLGARQYKLVRPLLSSAEYTSPGFIFHANFLAKPVDDPQAPDELFFVEIVTRGGGTVKPIRAYIIKSLGNTNSLPADDDIDDKRCPLCTTNKGPNDTDAKMKKWFEKIHHPKNVKLNYQVLMEERLMKC
ncbi:hypothetical protein KSS87_003570 [Heliosperma pusillum]|nr:hypothetical protein KSS87_003570 [Heliosperma pusillum]